MQFWQALLVGILGYCAVNRVGWFGGHTITGSITAPLVACTIFGVIFGKPALGLEVGAAMAAMFLGVISPGGALPSDKGMATFIGASLAIASGGGVEVAIALAVPLGILGAAVFQAFMTFNAVFPHIGDKYAAIGDGKGVRRANLLAQIPTAIFYITLYTVANYVGIGLVEKLIEIIPAFVLSGLKITAKVLPALGFAMLLKYTIPVGKEWMICFFLMGFVLVKNTSMNIVSLLCFAVGIAVVYTMARYGDKLSVRRGDDDDE